MTVKLIWITPNAEDLLVYIARVSSPKSQTEGLNSSRLLRYLIKHKHWSPFEMASACVEVNTTRDMGRQLLRHRSFSFQEFSQRYADVSKLEVVAPREARMQDQTNRQNSLKTDDLELKEWWSNAQAVCSRDALELYQLALQKGIAKEVARAVLPEGLTPTRMYMSGTLRSWIHYLEQRCSAAQLEHRELAQVIRGILWLELPHLFDALHGEVK